MGTFQKISAKVKDAVRKIRGSRNTHPHVQRMTDSQLAERLVCLDEPPPTVTAPRVAPTHPPRVQPPRVITDESPDRYPFDDFPQQQPQPQPGQEPVPAPAPTQPHYYPKTQGSTDRRFQP